MNLAGYKLTFDDEFATPSITRGGTGGRWHDVRPALGTLVVDHYFSDAAFVDPAFGVNPFSYGNGALTITATPAPASYAGPEHWVSGLAQTQNSFSQEYGYFEIRAALPAQNGAWPAFWLLPSDGSWPPELDVLESYGSTSLYQTVHTTVGGPNEQTVHESVHPDMTTGFHTYGVNWNAATVTFYYDGTAVASQATPADMHQSMYMLLDLAVEANAAAGAKTIQVDYVRAFSNDPHATAVELGQVSSPDRLTSADLHGAVAASPASSASDPSTISLGYALAQEHLSDVGGRSFLTGPDGVAHDVTGLQHFIFTDGTINQNTGAAALVDNLYYDITNLDVWNAHMDPTLHYNTFGWHEGRDPDAFFSTNGYLASNPDVAAAHVNPLTHYDTFGWKEGRDPSAHFDDALYLQHNGDVKAAGTDPLVSYLDHGRAEGRAAYAAVGPSPSFAHGSFDGEYYLLANADVARAALNSGQNPFDFAYQSYETTGWKEGRNPNAFFDVRSYLSSNPDVKAAGIDPLLHYDAWGWHEGRNPSASFNTAAYEAHNPDVAAAHVNPLTHYLEYGIHEGRATSI